MYWLLAGAAWMALGAFLKHREDWKKRQEAERARQIWIDTYGRYPYE